MVCHSEVHGGGSEDNCNDRGITWEERWRLSQHRSRDYERWSRSETKKKKLRTLMYIYYVCHNRIIENNQIDHINKKRSLYKLQKQVSSILTYERHGQYIKSQNQYNM